MPRFSKLIRVRWNHLEAALVAAAQEAAQSTAQSPPLRVPIPVAFAVAPPVLGEHAALARFAALSRIEAAPRLQSLLAAADSHALLRVPDDDFLTLGSGAGGRTWSIGCVA